jgi:hypothetical protein
MFASQTQDTIPIPFDPPHTVTVRKLTGRELEAAQAAHRDSLTTGNPRSWAALFRRGLQKGASDPDVLKAIADPLTGYDRYVMVRAGLLAWSYPQSITPVTVKVEGKPDRIVDAIDDLDDEGVDFIATEILRLTKPALFVTVEEAVAEKKSV